MVQLYSNWSKTQIIKSGITQQTLTLLGEGGLQLLHGGGASGPLIYMCIYIFPFKCNYYIYMCIYIFPFKCNYFEII